MTVRLSTRIVTSPRCSSVRTIELVPTVFSVPSYWIQGGGEAAWRFPPCVPGSAGPTVTANTTAIKARVRFIMLPPENKRGAYGTPPGELLLCRLGRSIDRASARFCEEDHILRKTQE